MVTPDSVVDLPWTTPSAITYVRSLSPRRLKLLGCLMELSSDGLPLVLDAIESARLASYDVDVLTAARDSMPEIDRPIFDEIVSLAKDGDHV